MKSARNANVYNGSLAQNAVVDAVLIERRKELFGEGFSLSDIIRTQGTVVRKPFVDADGKPIKVQITTPDGTVKTVDGKGHSVLDFRINLLLHPIVTIIYSVFLRESLRITRIYKI